MKILFCCDASGTGFSSAGSVIFNELQKATGWDMSLFALNNFNSVENIKKLAASIFNLPEDKIYTPLLPYNVSNQTNPFNKEVISNALYGLYNVGDVLEKVNPDIFFIFNDLYPCEWLSVHARASKWKGKIFSYIPIDTEINKGSMKNHGIIDKIVGTTFHGAKCMTDTGYKKKIDVIYHPVKETFYKMSEENIKEERKKLLGERHMNKFIVINANKNQFRKRQDLTVEGFSIFAKDKPDVALFLKCEICDDNQTGRYNIKKLLEESYKKYNLDVNNKIIVNSENITYEQINILYNICDLSLNTTSGEGFGYIPVEFAKLEKPFLVSNNTSYPELFKGYPGLIPCVKSIPIVSMNHAVMIEKDSNVILFQCFKKKHPTDVDEITYVQNFDTPVVESYIVNNIEEFNNLMVSLSKKKDLILFQVCTQAGDSLNNAKNMRDRIKLPKWIYDNFKIVMLDQKLLKVLYDGYQLNSYIPTPETVAAKLEEFYQYWKNNKPMPLAKIPDGLEKDVVIQRFKKHLEDLMEQK